MRKQGTGFMRKSSLLVTLCLVMLLTVVGCGSSKTKGDSEKKADEKSITLEVVDNNGDTTPYEINTDKEFLYDAVADVDGLTLDGYEGDYGYYITAVNGLQADYEIDGAYWSLYVNDEYGMHSISQQPVTEGDTYKLVYELANE